MSARLLLRHTAAALALLVGAGTTLGAAPAAAQSPQWAVVTLQPLPGTTTTHVFDVNRYGYAVGMSDSKPVLWSPDGLASALPLGGGTTGAAFSINDAGVIVGTRGWPAPIPGRDAVAWVYGTVVPIVANGDALSVNEANIVVGCSGGTAETGAAGRRPFVAQLGSAPLTLPTSASAPAGCAGSINDWGAIGGLQRTTPAEGTGVPSARLWFQGAGYSFTGTPQHLAEITDVSNSGYALARVAATGTPSNPTHSALVAPGGQYAVLEPLAIASTATGLTTQGVVVGTRVTDGGGNGSSGAFTEAVLWAYGTTVPLTTLVPSSALSQIVGATPTAVNDALSIVGNKGSSSWIMHRFARLPTTGGFPG